MGFSGSVDTASTLTEIFLLEYADGKAQQDIAWGRLTKQQIQQVTQLHTLDFNLTGRTPYEAQVLASNLLPHIFELRLNAAGQYLVRVYFSCQTIDQMHDATPLTLQSGPSLVPIFVPNASGNNAYFDCPLGAFSAMVDRAVNLKFTN